MMRRPEKVFGNNPMWLKESSPAKSIKCGDDDPKVFLLIVPKS